MMYEQQFLSTVNPYPVSKYGEILVLVLSFDLLEGDLAVCVHLEIGGAGLAKSATLFLSQKLVKTSQTVSLPTQTHR